ncbi:hypothetical protein Tco_0825872, partial [Tanacetum coccineum]
STPMDTSEKLMPNNGQAVSQLEYSRVIGCLMYAMTCTMPDIAFAMGKLSMYTSNPGTQHWQAIQQVTLMQAGSATLKIIRLQVAGYSCLVVVRFLGIPRNKLASVSLNFIESIKEARSRVQDLTSGEIVSLNLLSRTRKFGHSMMELRLVPSCFAIFTFEPLTLSLTSMPSCDLESLTNILILCLILKASDQSLRKSLSLNLELS